jgi:hypothetical protein
MVFEGRRQERLRLFGYVKLKSGEVISIDEASTRLKASITQNPTKRILPILPEDVLEWHQPETFRDCINSVGEVDVPKEHEYPALGLSEGDVLRDPKTRPSYLHPALRGQ